jgi:hypothetical protein
MSHVTFVVILHHHHTLSGIKRKWFSSVHSVVAVSSRLKSCESNKKQAMEAQGGRVIEGSEGIPQWFETTLLVAIVCSEPMVDYRRASSRSSITWMKWFVAVGLLLCNVSWAFAPPLPTRNSGRESLSPHSKHIPLAPPALSMAIEKSDLELDDDSTIDDEEEVDIDSVSDAEALLAVRAYLQRKNRLGEWTQYKQRKQRREQAARDLKESSWGSDSTGFFWEDPSELKYFNRKPVDVNMTLVVNVEDEFNFDAEDDEEEKDDDFEEDLWETLSPRRIDHRIEYYDTEIEREEEDLRLQGSEDYSVFDTGPSPSRIRRSQAAKLMWSDPEFKAKWYEKRWGVPSKFTAKEKQQKCQLKKRLSNFQPDSLLANEELAKLTEEEIADAIRTYVVSKRRRSESTKQTLQKRKEALLVPNPDTPLPRDLLLRQDPDTMRELQRRRSEKSKMAYATRLEKKEKGSKTRTVSADLRSLAVRKASVSTAATPRDALLRMQIDLEEGKIPHITDVELVLQPLKLGKRKDMLRRILSDHFDLRGKCVPVDPDLRETSDLMFATQCSIDQLGEFVIHKLRERRDQRKG